MRPFRLFFVLLCLSSAVSANLPFNLTSIKQQLTEYHDSGQYLQDIRDVTNSATSYLRYRVYQNRRRAHPKKLAIVFDIDETLLSNYQKMKHSHFGGGGPISNNDPAITPTAALFNKAKRWGVTVFLITGRANLIKNRRLTEENLTRVGLTGWKALYLKPLSYQHMSAVPYKSSTRKRIERSGFDIVLSMGDQMSDLTGGAADNTFKLPNPFYFIA